MGDSLVFGVNSELKFDPAQCGNVTAMLSPPTPHILYKTYEAQWFENGAISWLRATTELIDDPIMALVDFSVAAEQIDKTYGQSDRMMQKTYGEHDNLWINLRLFREMCSISWWPDDDGRRAFDDLVWISLNLTAEIGEKFQVSATYHFKSHSA